MTPNAPPGPARAAPDVRVVSNHAGLQGDAFGLPSALHRRRARRDANAPIVMCLLAASTTLALYDLYVLISALVPSAHP